MVAKRVTSFMAVLSAVLLLTLCSKVVSAQSAPFVTRGNRAQTFPLAGFGQTRVPTRPRTGPLTPGDWALQGQKRSHSARRFTSSPSSFLSATFLGALDYNSAGESTNSVAAADLNGDGDIDLAMADQCADNNCSHGSVSILVGNGDGTFQPAASYSTGALYAYGIAIGDVNGDGKLDVLVSNICADNNCNSGAISVLLGNGDGTFQPATSYSTGALDAYGIAVGDVNGDGKLDVLVSNNCANNNCNSGAISVLLGNGDGTLQTAVTYSSGGLNTQSVAIADVNGDGKLDLLAANICADNNCRAGSVGVLLGNGDGTFQTASSYNSGGENATSAVVIDLNGDGKADIVVANQIDNNGNWTDGSVTSVLLGNGDGTFQPAVSYATGDYSAQAVTLADVNNDGKPDVVVANACLDPYSCNNGVAAVLLGNGDGSFRAAKNYNSGAWDSNGVAVADVNKDGKPDILIASSCDSNSSCSHGTASVLLGNGDGTFQSAVAYNSGGLNTYSILSADVNGDGKPDLLVTNECSDNTCTQGSLAVLLGNGDGTFQSATSYGSNGLYPYAMAIGDVNHDGNPDLVLANQCADNNCSGGSVAVLLSNGDGTFQSAVTYGAGALYSFSVGIADVNGDGKVDLLVANQCADSNCNNGTIGVLLGNGDGTFQTVASYNSGGLYAFALAIGDLNGDGKPDAIVANQCTTTNCTNGAIAVLLGNGDGTFQTATTTTTPVLGGIQMLAIGDFNGDHKLDVASGDGNLLLFGNGDGTFQSGVALGASGSGIAVGDFNGDGRPDLAIGGVNVLLNVSTGFVFATTTNLSSSANPSTYGASVTLTATVTSQVAGTPTGTITFSDGANTLGQVTLSGGTASYSTTALALGSHSITASYSGDSTFASSASTSLSEVVQKTNTTTILQASPGTANVNQTVTLTATVSSGSSFVPSGTVSFVDGTTELGSSDVNGSGVATLLTATLSAGTHSITAVYSGDADSNSSTSIAASVVVIKSNFSLSSSGLSPASVAPGGSAHSNISIGTVGGLNPSAVKLSCSVSPVVDPPVTCSIGAISVTGTTGSATLTVATTGPVAALAPGSGKRGAGNLMFLAFFVPGLLLCGTGMRNANHRKLLAAGFVLLLLTGCMLQTACGGATSGGTHGSGTPAGTYTVMVTGSWNGMQQTKSASLIVQ